MNAIITLPSASIQKINDEKKDILILNAYPCHFDVKKGRLLISKEESGVVVGTLKIMSAFQCTKFIRVWWRLRKRIAHKDDGWFYYAFLCKKYFLFEIDNIQMYNQTK